MASLQLPPGFRFHPTDQELVEHYLKEKVTKQLGPDCVIVDVDLLAHEPWDLPSLSSLSEGEWYFFSPRDRKYPKGSRANRATEKGYWKATGKDKAVLAGGRRRPPAKGQPGNKSPQIGMKKTLVFYQGRAPHGTRTGWVMHEYRLEEDGAAPRVRQGDFVLCRVFNKSVVAAAQEDADFALAVGAGTDSAPGQDAGPEMGAVAEDGRWYSGAKAEAVSDMGLEKSGVVEEDEGSAASPVLASVVGVSAAPLSFVEAEEGTEAVFESAVLRFEELLVPGPDFFPQVGPLSAQEQELIDEFFPGTVLGRYQMPEGPNAAFTDWQGYLESPQFGSAELGGGAEDVQRLAAAAAPSAVIPGWAPEQENAGRGPLTGDSLSPGVGPSTLDLDEGTFASWLTGLVGEGGEAVSFAEVGQLVDELAEELDAAEQQQQQQLGMGNVASSAAGARDVLAAASVPVRAPASGQDSAGEGETVASGASTVPRRSLDEDLRQVLRAHGVVVDQSDLLSPSLSGSTVRSRPPQGPSAAVLGAPSLFGQGRVGGQGTVRLQVLAAPHVNLGLDQGFLPEFQEALAFDSAMSLGDEATVELARALPDESEHRTQTGSGRGEAVLGPWPAMTPVRRVVVGGWQAPVTAHRAGLGSVTLEPQDSDRLLLRDQTVVGDQGSLGAMRASPPALTVPSPRAGGPWAASWDLVQRASPRPSGSRAPLSSLAQASALDRSNAPSARMTPTLLRTALSRAQFADASRPVVIGRDTETSARTLPLSDSIVLSKRERCSHAQLRRPFACPSGGMIPHQQKQRFYRGGASGTLTGWLEKLPALPASAAELQREPCLDDCQHNWGEALLKSSFKEITGAKPCAPAVWKRPLYVSSTHVTFTSLLALIVDSCPSWGPWDWALAGALAVHSVWRLLSCCLY